MEPDPYIIIYGGQICVQFFKSGVQSEHLEFGFGLLWIRPHFGFKQPNILAEDEDFGIKDGIFEVEGGQFLHK